MHKIEEVTWFSPAYAVDRPNQKTLKWHRWIFILFIILIWEAHFIDYRLVWRWGSKIGKYLVFELQYWILTEKPHSIRSPLHRNWKQQVVSREMYITLSNSEIPKIMWVHSKNLYHLHKLCQNLNNIIYTTFTTL